MIKKSYLLLVMLQTLFIMNVRAQELKTPTLEDLIPSGETFRFPENLYGLQWWGDECIKPDIGTLFAVNPYKRVSQPGTGTEPGGKTVLFLQRPFPLGGQSADAY